MHISGYINLAQIFTKEHKDVKNFKRQQKIDTSPIITNKIAATWPKFFLS